MKQYCRYCIHCNGDYCNEQFYCKRKNKIMDYKSVINKNTCESYSYSNYDIITNKEHKERKKEEIMTNSLFNEKPCTVLACDIEKMTEKDFLAFCKKAYRKAHNIEEKINLSKILNEEIVDFTEYVQTIEKESKRTYKFLNNLRYNKTTGNAITSIVNQRYTKKFKEMSNAEQTDYCKQVKRGFKWLRIFIYLNRDEINEWQNIDRNVTADQMEEAILERNLNNYIKQSVITKGYENEPSKSVTNALTKLAKQMVYTIYLKPNDKKGGRSTYFSNKHLVDSLLLKMLPIIYKKDETESETEDNE